MQWYPLFQLVKYNINSSHFKRKCFQNHEKGIALNSICLPSVVYIFMIRVTNMELVSICVLIFWLKHNVQHGYPKPNLTVHYNTVRITTPTLCAYTTLHYLKKKPLGVLACSCDTANWGSELVLEKYFNSFICTIFIETQDKR